MSVSAKQKKQYRNLGHKLNPVVTIAAEGLTSGVLNELNRALNDHELIKVKIAREDRQQRKQLIHQICQDTGAELIDDIGKIALILRPVKNPNPKLSNLLR